jgi:uncharacterized protein (DUF3084 family)
MCALRIPPFCFANSSGLMKKTKFGPARPKRNKPQNHCFRVTPRLLRATSHHEMGANAAIPITHAGANVARLSRNSLRIQTATNNSPAIAADWCRT